VSGFDPERLATADQKIAEILNAVIPWLAMISRHPAKPKSNVGWCPARGSAGGGGERVRDSSDGE